MTVVLAAVARARLRAPGTPRDANRSDHRAGGVIRVGIRRSGFVIGIGWLAAPASPNPRSRIPNPESIPNPIYRQACSSDSDSSWQHLGGYNPPERHAAMPSTETRDFALRLLAELPDVPRWIEARAILRSPHAQLFAGPVPADGSRCSALARRDVGGGGSRPSAGVAARYCARWNNTDDTGRRAAGERGACQGGCSARSVRRTTAASGDPSGCCFTR